MSNQTDDNVPYIDPPNILDDDMRNGLYCFMDRERQCGADCMAFLTDPRDVPELGPQQQYCSLISCGTTGAKSLEYVAKALYLITENQKVQVKEVKKAAAAASRAAQPKPPDPMGRR